MTKIEPPRFVLTAIVLLHSLVRMKETVTIEIAGSTYRLVSDSGAQHLQHLAKIVNSRVDALGFKGSRHTSPAQKLALVALSLVDDLENVRQTCLELQRDAREVAIDAIGRLDRRLEADEAGEDTET